MINRKSHFAPLALFSGVALAPLALAVPQGGTSGPDLPDAGDAVAPTIASVPVELQNPEDLKGTSPTVATGLADLQEEGLDSFYGVQADGTLYLKSLIGVTDSISIIDAGVSDAATLSDYYTDGVDTLDAIVAVGPGIGLSLYTLPSNANGVPIKTSVDDSLTGGHVTTGDLTGDQNPEIIVSTGTKILVYNGVAPHAQIATHVTSGQVKDVLTLNWTPSNTQQIHLQYGNGFEIFEYVAGTFMLADARFGGNFTSHYGVLHGSSPYGRDELVWVLDHPALGWVSLTLWDAPGSMTGASPIGLLSGLTYVTGIATGDVSEDGNEDLVLSVSNSSYYRLLVNQSELGSLRFSSAANVDFMIPTGVSGVISQAPAAIGDFDDSSNHEIAMSVTSTGGDHVTVLDNVSPTIASQAPVPLTSNFTGAGDFQYVYTNGASTGSGVEDDFIEFPTTATYATNDFYFHADQTIPGASQALQIGVFYQASEWHRVEPQAFTHTRGVPPSVSNGGVANEYAFAFDDAPAVRPSGEWLSQVPEPHLYFYLRPERGGTAQGNRIARIVGVRLGSAHLGTNEGAIEDGSVTLPQGGENPEMILSDGGLTLPAAAGFGYSCPAPVTRAPVGGIWPIKRLKPPAGVNPTLGVASCLESNNSL